MYEILDDYQQATDDIMKDDIFKAFCFNIWSSKNKRKIITKSIKFNVRKDLLQTDLGKVFDVWSNVEYLSYRSMSKEKGYISLIRQKVNNIYTNLFDARICSNKEYMDLIRMPKTLYYRWIDGEYMEADDVTMLIDNAIFKAEEIKKIYSKQKMQLSWMKYKKECEKYFRRMFDNYISIDDYEDKSIIHNHSDCWNEDHFCISYFCKGLDGYFKNYQKEYYGIKHNGKKSASQYLTRCKDCEALIKKTGNKKMYCDACADKRRKNSWKKASKKYKMGNHKIENGDKSHN